ncbi:hypothetical protein Zmor_027773 [Zophobas morio]|uniref:Uncharacterized protein n=1 Tax=Zophobas morio TaxID=2755281 RepID=A0AA38M3B7_9CUCU|nr:hypothetical protein Zmor_027773 [Zophobas morio]
MSFPAKNPSFALGSRSRTGHTSLEALACRYPEATGGSGSVESSSLAQSIAIAHVRFSAFPTRMPRSEPPTTALHAVYIDHFPTVSPVQSLRSSCS